MTDCPCACHNGPHYPCSEPGGCNYLHRNERRPDLREARVLLGASESVTVAAPVPAAVEAAPEPRQERPAGACVTHLPPRPGYHWRRADDGYRTCAPCYDQLHKWLSPYGMDDEGRPDNIPLLYLTLNSRPGSNGPGRRSPGFGSRSPGDDRVISMRDPRTVQVEDGDPCSAAGVLRQWVLWVWDERYDDAALNERDYRRRLGALPTVVSDAAAWLDKQLDWLTRHDVITDFYTELRELRRQLRGVTGDGGQPPVGHCIEILASGECRAAIYMPRGEKPRAPDEPIRDLPKLTCPACGTEYEGTRLLRLKLSQRKTAGGAGNSAA